MWEDDLVLSLWQPSPLSPLPPTRLHLLKAHISGTAPLPLPHTIRWSVWDDLVLSGGDSPAVPGFTSLAAYSDDLLWGIFMANLHVPSISVSHIHTQTTCLLHHPHLPWRPDRPLLHT